MIVSLDSEAARDAARTGGKASTLARLRAAGFPVPEGFVVTADDGASADLVTSLEDLQRRTGPGVRFAVRSSSRAEDSAAASFAGQYDTVLGVRGADEVSRAITRCFASFSSARVSAYQSAVGVRDAAGAVIVQRLVPADAAGVAFTRDPVTGTCDRVVIDAFLAAADRHVSVFALLMWLGFRREFIEYDKQPRVRGKSGWTLARKVKLVIDSIVGFSDFPIWWCIYGGAGAMLVALIPALAAAVAYPGLDAALWFLGALVIGLFGCLLGDELLVHGLSLLEVGLQLGRHLG